MSFLVFSGGILGRFFGILDDFFDIAKPFLGFSLHLFLQALDLLLFVAHQFAGFFLNFASDIFDQALGLIFIHADFSYVDRSGYGRSKNLIPVCGLNSNKEDQILRKRKN